MVARQCVLLFPARIAGELEVVEDCAILWVKRVRITFGRVGMTALVLKQKAHCFGGHCGVADHAFRDLGRAREAETPRIVVGVAVVGP